jgi:hypothetical protein
VLKTPKEKPKIDAFKCPKCRGVTKVVFQTPTKIWFKCKRGHKESGVLLNEAFGVPRSAFEGGD